MVGVLVRAPVRSFSTTGARRLDFASLYNNLTSWRKPAAPKKLYDPTTQSDDATREEMPVDSQPRRLRMLGKPPSKRSEWPKVKEFAEFTAWPTNLHRKDLSAEDIKLALAEAFTNGDKDVADITARFNAIKAVQQKLQIAIPDTVFSSMQSVKDLEKHLTAAARDFDEKAPDSLFLDPSDFVGTNITIKDHVGERRALKKRYQTLLKEATKAQDIEATQRLQT